MEKQKAIGTKLGQVKKLLTSEQRKPLWELRERLLKAEANRIKNKFIGGLL